MKKLRRHLSYANVVSTLALIAAVAGGTTAVAVKKAPKGKLVRVTKSSDINPKGVIRSQRVGKDELGLNVVGANQLGQLHRYLVAGPGTAPCAGGERLISGGAGFNSGVTYSAPAQFNAQGWDGSGNGSGSVHAICLAP